MLKLEVGQGKAWVNDTVASLYLTTISIKSLRNRVQVIKADQAASKG